MVGGPQKKSKKNIIITKHHFHPDSQLSILALSDEHDTNGGREQVNFGECGRSSVIGAIASSGICANQWDMTQHFIEQSGHTFVYQADAAENVKYSRTSKMMHCSVSTLNH